MAKQPAMSREEVEEVIEQLSTHVDIRKFIADDMLDAGHLVTWATGQTHEGRTEEEVGDLINEILDETAAFVQDRLDDGYDIEIVILGLWLTIQNLEESMRSAPSEEIDEEESRHPLDRMTHGR